LQNVDTGEIYADVALGAEHIIKRTDDEAGWSFNIPGDWHNTVKHTGEPIGRMSRHTEFEVIEDTRVVKPVRIADAQVGDYITFLDLTGRPHRFWGTKPKDRYQYAAAAGKLFEKDNRLEGSFYKMIGEHCD
jgi:hypothetical protein